MKRCVALLALLAAAAGLSAASAPSATASILPLKDRIAVQDRWLGARLETVLPELMRREAIDMWIVVCREYNEDPVFLSLMPAASLSARRLSILVFFDRGDKGIEKISVGRYPIGTLYRAAWRPEKDGPDQWQALAAVVKERDPKRIGINESELFAFGDGLSASLKSSLVKALGSALSGRLVSAERLAVGWLERRIPAELEVYPHIVSVAHGIIAEAFSAAVITPGITTADDVEWWMWEKIRSLRLDTWFPPSISIQRRGEGEPQERVIRPGDLLHCDMGISYLGLMTDQQQHAYVLKPGETAPPAGLSAALAEGNRLQDVLLAEFREGRTGNEVLASALKAARAAGLKPSIYTHPLGVHGHAAGPTIGLWDQQGGVPGQGDYPLYYDTCYSIELNAKVAVPEWGGQEVTIALEEDAAFTRAGAWFLDGRQTALYCVR